MIRSCGNVETYTGYLGHAWEYDGLAWSERVDVAVQPSPARKKARLEYDSGKKTVVLFGGYGDAGATFTDTWEFDGNCWKDASGASRPPELRFTMSAYDRARQKLVLFGGAEPSASGMSNAIFLR